MAISKRLFIYATFILSCGAIALTVTAFATKSWLESEMKVADPDSLQTKNDFINYGLFSGTLERNLLATPMIVDVYITCMDNSCVWSCNKDEAERVNELEQLIATGTVVNLRGCDPSRSNKLLEAMWEEKDSMEHGDRRNRDYEEKEGKASKKEVDQTFLNAGVRISTIVFLSLALLFAITAAVFAVINSAINPIERITGIFGLYIWNGLAALCDVLVLSLWGGHFASTLSNNVAYTEVIMGDLISKDLAVLGYSYWCVLGAMFLHLFNVGLLGIRQMMLNREPEPSTIKVEENNDGTILFY